MASSTRNTDAVDTRSRFVRADDIEGAFKTFDVMRADQKIGTMQQPQRGGSWTFTGPRKTDKPEDIGRTKFDAMRNLRERDTAPEPRAAKPDDQAAA